MFCAWNPPKDPEPETLNPRPHASGSISPMGRLQRPQQGRRLCTRPGKCWVWVCQNFLNPKPSTLNPKAREDKIGLGTD